MVFRKIMNGQQKLSRLWKIDRSWTLFLDRDGVINKRVRGGYVRRVEEFEFLEGVLEAIPELNRVFGRLVMVTNQQGIGKGLMTEEDLKKVHDYMIQEILKHGGRVDAVYFSPFLEQENHPMRKPGTGMALKAREDFPDIEFRRSVMVGDSPSDVEFGKKCGMKTVLIRDETENIRGISEPDCVLMSLREFLQRI